MGGEQGWKDALYPDRSGRQTGTLVGRSVVVSLVVHLQVALVSVPACSGLRWWPSSWSLDIDERRATSDEPVDRTDRRRTTDRRPDSPRAGDLQPRHVQTRPAAIDRGIAQHAGLL